MRIGERNGLEDRPAGDGDGETCTEGFMTVGSECARVMRGALSEPELECERRWLREYGERFRGRGWSEE